MTEVAGIPASLDSLFGQISPKFDQNEAENVIHEIKRLYPTIKDSFDQTDLYGALKQLYVLGAISDEGNQKLLEILAKKASKKDQILDLISGYKEVSSCKDDFVGRDNDVENIRRLTNPRVPGINLYGDSGVGKTTLSKEVSKKLELEEDFEPFLIDLRGTKDMNTVYFKVLEMFKLTPWDYSKERIYKHLHSLATKTILILDNVEQFLSNVKEVDQKRRTDFLEFLRTIMSSETSKSGNLKVILTSKIEIRDTVLETIHFTEYELLPLTKKYSRQLMSWRRMRDESDDEQEKALNEIADLCRNTPYLLERAQQLMRQNFSKPSEVLEKLNESKTKGVPERFACISALFESLPSDQLRQVAVKISLLQGSFSVSTAMKIADFPSDYDAELDLEMLATHKVIKAEDVNRKRKYDFHELFREFVTSYMCKEDTHYKDAYEEAESQFVEHFSKILTQHAKNLDKDFVGTYKELEENKANLELSIDLITRKETFDLILQSDDVKGTGSVAILFEAFKSIEEKRKLFGEWAKIVEKKESWLSNANLRCWESLQLADMQGTQSACETLKRAEMSLAKAMLLLMPEQIIAAKGLYKFCSGRIKCMTSANLIDESSKEEKKQLLEQALSDLHQSLDIHKEIYGDHTLTARTLNLIGNCHMERGEPNEALKFYQRAMEMKTKLVGSEEHFDIPTYYNQLSQVYEALGKENTSTFKENYEKAVYYINKALNLQKELGINDTVSTATFQRNLANILIGLEKYDEALEQAKKSFEIRNANLGKHPETVRILYLIGVIHEKKEDKEAALQSYEEAFVMEESLPEDNHSVVRKRLCDKLKAMCDYLDEKDKLKEYGPRMDKIQKETNVDVGQKTDAAADGAGGQGTDLLTLDKKGGYYDFSSDYFFLEVPCNAVNAPVEVKYKVDTCSCQPTMAGITKSVSYFLEMSSSMTEALNEPITMTLMHSGPGKEYGYKTTAMTFNKDKDVWEELPVIERKHGSRVSNFRRRKANSIRVQISKVTILAVVTRLITDRFQVTPKGCVVRSSVCHDVTVEFPEGAVDKNVEGNLKLLLMAQRMKLENDEYGYPCPILLVDGFENVTLQKPVTITMPHPCPEKYPVEKVILMRLPNETENLLKNNWEDITDQIIHHKQIKKDQKCFIELKVQHFSWLSVWVPFVPLQTLQIIFNNLISSPPLYVRVGLFKAKDALRRPVSMLKAFKVTLTCVANHDDRYLKEMKETHEELAIATSVNPLRPGDKALVKVEGDFKEKGQSKKQEQSILVFLKDEKFDTELNVCRKREEAQNENDRNRELVISLYKEIDDCFLCKLSTGETEDIEETLCPDRAYKMRRTPPRGYFVIVNINKFDLSTGLKERKGSDQDVKNLKSLFEDLLGFRIQIMHEDAKISSNILKELMHIFQQDFSNYDCFVLCIMSHGKDDFFYGSDGTPITWSTIVSLFYKAPLLGLKDKPKLFFFQACRSAPNTEHHREAEHNKGAEHDTRDKYDTASAGHDTGVEHARETEHDRAGTAHHTGNEHDPRPKQKSSSRITYLPTDVQDTLVVHSCFQGHESFRNSRDGTFFIQSLVRVLKENVNNEDVSSMITMVTNELATQLGEKQVPQMSSTLRKKLYFKPEMKFQHFHE